MVTRVCNKNIYCMVLNQCSCFFLSRSYGCVNVTGKEVVQNAGIRICSLKCVTVSGTKVIFVHITDLQNSDKQNAYVQVVGICIAHTKITLCSC